MERECRACRQINTTTCTHERPAPCLHAAMPGAWWCAKVATELDGMCRPCSVAERWVAAGADPDQTPSFLRPRGEL